MAGDWIKVEHATPDKPEVVKLADMLGIDQDAVVGKLLRLWIWADQQSVSGNAITVTNSFLDRLVFCPGFAVGLVKVGWLNGRNGLLSIPNFDRHNGQTAKNRANTNRRVANHRKGVNAKIVTDVTHEPLQKPLPEKRREENNTIGENTAYSRKAPLPEDSDKVKVYLQAEVLRGRLCLIESQINEVSMLFYADKEACGWVDAKGNPINNWQAAALAYALRYAENRRGNPALNNAKSTPKPSRRDDFWKD